MGTARWTPEQLAHYRSRRGAALFDAPLQPAAGHAFWPIVPTPAPRQVRKDAYDPCPSVSRYRAFCDECVLKKVWHPRPGDLVVFLMRIPKSREKDRLEGTPHLQKPDADNLLKSLLDALYGDDSHIWTITPAKVWSTISGIYIERRDPVIEIPFRLPGGLAA